MSSKKRRRSRNRRAGAPGKSGPAALSAAAATGATAAAAGGAAEGPGAGAGAGQEGGAGKAGFRLPGRRPILTAAIAVAVIGAAAGAYVLLRPKPVRVVRDPGLNVLLITLDTTRADRLGCYGYAGARTPNLDAIAANGVRFADAYAPAPLTLPSHCTIMTGELPLKHGVHNNGAYVLGPEAQTLAEALKAAGRRTAAFTASFSVDSRFGLSQGFDRYDDDLQEGAPFKALNAERKAEQVEAAFSRWFEGVRDGESFFAWVHFFDPHLPYSPPAPFSDELAGRPYDGEIAYMDHAVGVIMRRLRDRGLVSKTLVVVAGDHGEGFGEKGESGHGVFLYEPTLRVPLLVYAEGKLPWGKVVEERVRLADVMPTILDLVELKAPEGIQGASLLPLIDRRERKDRDAIVESFYPRENFGWAALTGIVRGKWKYIQAPRAELYDLKADPGEERNEAAEEAETAAGLKAALDGVLKAAVTGMAEPKILTGEEQARLRSLGYVDYADPNAKRDADPKDRVDELKMIQEAEKADYEGRFAEAVELHRKMLAMRPSTPSSYINLALSLARLKRLDEAVATLKSGLEKIPGNELLMTRLGFTYLVMGRPQEALAAMGEALRVNSRSVDALTAVAVILDNVGRKDEAREAFERALAAEPESRFLRAGYASNLAAAGRLGEAIQIYETLVRDFPKDTAYYRSLGIAYAMSGELDKAIETFKQITYIAPSPEAYFNLAMAYKSKGEAAEAARWFERYLENPAGEPEARIARARAELKK